MKSVLFAFFLMAILITTTRAEDYSFEIPTLDDDEKILEWSGNLDAKYSVFHMREDSPFYKLTFTNSDSVSEYLSQYRLELYLNGDYQTKDMGFHLKTHTTYFDDSKDVDFGILEAYVNINLSITSFVRAGKKMYNWGKGYAFNPVGYVNPFKDPEDPELAQAGLLSINFEKIKSFNSPLKTYAFTAIVIPPIENINDKFGELKNTDFAVKNYFLLWDIDFDLMGYYSKTNPKQVGFDFATNIKENIELHGEFSYIKDKTKYKIVDDEIFSEEADGYSYLLGLRYLNQNGTTLIGEYYHNDLGLTKEEYRAYSDFLLNSAQSSDTTAEKKALQYAQTYFKSSNLTQDYLYLKVQHPEPFGLLYFTPSIFTIYNLSDNSFSFSSRLSYKPITNLELILWHTFLNGEEGTEFGAKQNQQKIQAWVRIYF